MASCSLINHRHITNAGRSSPMQHVPLHTSLLAIAFACGTAIADRKKKGPCRIHTTAQRRSVLVDLPLSPLRSGPISQMAQTSLARPLLSYRASS